MVLSGYAADVDYHSTQLFYGCWENLNKCSEEAWCVFVNSSAEINAAACHVITECETDRKTKRPQVFHFSSYFPTTYRIQRRNGSLGLSRNQPFADFNSKYLYQCLSNTRAQSV